MTDHLHPVLDDAAIARMTSLALAHVGDAVYEILVRTHLACGGTQTAKNLHSRTIQLVRASAQAEAVKRIQPMLDADRSASRTQRKAEIRAEVGLRGRVCLRDCTRGAVRLAVPQGTL